jgi:hypothetical protein
LNSNGPTTTGLHFIGLSDPNFQLKVPFPAGKTLPGSYLLDVHDEIAGTPVQSYFSNQSLASPLVSPPATIKDSGTSLL